MSSDRKTDGRARMLRAIPLYWHMVNNVHTSKSLCMLPLTFPMSAGWGHTGVSNPSHRWSPRTCGRVAVGEWPGSLVS